MDIDPTHQHQHADAQHEAEYCAAHCLLRQERQNFADVGIVSADGDCQDRQKHDNADAIIKEGFAGDRGFKPPRRLDLLEDAEDSDGIGRGDQRPKNERVDEWDIETKETRAEIEERPCGAR